MTDEKVETDGVPFSTHIINPIIKSLLRVGIPMPPMILLTVRGRKSGKPLTTPVGLFELDGRSYLFSSFGESNWVRNIRAAGEATLRRGRHRKAVIAVELPADEATPILKDAFMPIFKKRLMGRTLRSTYHVAPDSSPDKWSNAARRHPVFEVRER